MTIVNTMNCLKMKSKRMKVTLTEDEKVNEVAERLVNGLLKRNGKVYTVIIPDAKTDTLMPIIRQKVKPDSIVYTDTWRSYNTLDVSGFKHYRINHSELFANKTNHINGIENFWNQAKRHMRKFNGIPR